MKDPLPTTSYFKKVWQTGSRYDDPKQASLSTPLDPQPPKPEYRVGWLVTFKREDARLTGKVWQAQCRYNPKTGALVGETWYTIIVDDKPYHVTESRITDIVQ